jgi:hypothetical protein
MQRIYALLLLWIACCVWGRPAEAHPADSLERWTPRWLTAEEGVLQPAERWQAHPIGFFVLSEARAPRLYLYARTPFTWWVNRQLQGETSGWLALNADSLVAASGRHAYIGIHAPGGLAAVQVFRPQAPQSGWQVAPRKPPVFRDFVIIVSLLLAAFAVVLWRLSPRLFFDYLSFARLLSARPRDEPQLLRITASQNLLYYFFMAGWLSFLLLVLARYEAQTSVVLARLTGASPGGWLALWLGLTFFTVALLFAKYAAQYLVAAVYALTDNAADQFNTFVRLMFFFCMVVSAVLFASYLAGVDIAQPYFRAVALLLVLSCLILPFLGARFMRVSSFRYFHIFSYLCITEVIPLIVTFKILFY